MDSSSTMSKLGQVASLVARELVPRQQRCYYDRFNRYRCTRRGAFSSWGRWLLLGLIVGFFLLFLLCACITSRRRRSRGHKPIYGTGWMANGVQPNSQYAPPTGPPPGTTNNQYGPGAANSYYNGGNEGAYAPQKPEQSYGGYQAPAGPPPGQYR